MISPFTTAFILEKAKMMNKLVHLEGRRASDSLCTEAHQPDIFSEFYTDATQVEQKKALNSF